MVLESGQRGGGGGELRLFDPCSPYEGKRDTKSYAYRDTPRVTNDYAGAVRRRCDGGGSNNRN